MEIYEIVKTIISVLLGLLLYFIPSIRAHNKKKRNMGSILIINIFFGWTFFGWVIALAIAAANDK